MSERKHSTTTPRKLKARQTGSRKTSSARPAGVESHPRKIRVTKADMRDSPCLERLAKRLAVLQESSGLTKPEFAERLGISNSTYHKLRRRMANPTVQTLAEIGNGVDIPLFELLENASLGPRKNPSGEQMTRNFGNAVARFLETSGESKVAFADRIQIAWPHVYRIMDGRSNPTWLVAEHIAQRMGLTIWQLLGIEPLRFGPLLTRWSRNGSSDHSESIRRCDPMI